MTKRNEVEMTKAVIDRLKAFHSIAGNIVRCEWDIYRNEIAGLLQIDAGTIDALRVSGFYLNTDAGLRFSA